MPKIQPVIDTSLLAIENPFQLASRLTQRKPQQGASFFYPRRLRLSNIYDVCPREYILGIRNKWHRPSGVGSRRGMTTTLDIGSAAHHLLQNDARYFGAQRLGLWECLSCGYIANGRAPLVYCPQCRGSARAFIYKEYELRLDASQGLIGGHPDMFLQIPSYDTSIVVDFKTINGEEFKKLVAPTIEYIYQLCGYIYYMQFVKDLSFPISLEYGLIYYLSKGHIVGSISHKAFIIRLSQQKDIITDIKRKVASFTRGVLDTVYMPPVEGLCSQSNFKAYKSRSCPGLDYCLKHN